MCYGWSPRCWKISGGAGLGRGWEARSMKAKQQSELIWRSNKQVGGDGNRALAFVESQLPSGHVTARRPACIFYCCLDCDNFHWEWGGESRLTHTDSPTCVFPLSSSGGQTWATDADHSPTLPHPLPPISLHARWWPTKACFLSQCPALWPVLDPHRGDRETHPRNYQE